MMTLGDATAGRNAPKWNPFRRTTTRGKLTSTGIVGITAALALVAGACGSGGEDGASKSPDSNSSENSCPVDALDDITKPVDINVWHVQIGSPRIALEKIVDKYNASQDKVVVHAENQGTLNEQLKKFEDSMADPRSLPEIVQPDDTVTRFMADSGVAIPVSDCIEADPDSQAIYDDMLPIVKEAFSIDNVLWPGAFNAAGASLFVNERQFEDAGLDPKTLPKTLDELRATAEKLKAAKVKDAKGSEIDAPLVMRIDSWPLEYLISGADQPVVNEDNGRSGLATKAEYDNPVTLKVFEWVRDMHADGLLKYTDYNDQIAPFLAMASETSSMLIDSSSALSTVDAAISGTIKPEDVGLEDGLDLSGFVFPDLRITVGELPGLTGPGRGQMGGTAWYLVDDEDPAKIAAAWDFMKFFNQPEQQVIWALEGSSLPVSKKATESPELQKEWESTRLGQWMAITYKGFSSLNVDFPGPVIGPYKEFRQSVKNGVEDMINKGEDPKTTIATINSELQKSLDAYKADIGQ
ncbi:MAG: extracellular solute-binding protein [Microthrixaceae bacterium]